MKKKTSRTSSTPANRPACELCRRTGGDLIWHDRFCRVVSIRDPDYPGYCRVIWNSHVKEMTDLTAVQRAHCMRVVFAVERALRTVLTPDKVNLASFGNMAPHLHWHIIPRYLRDAHFPNPVWGPRRRLASSKLQNLPMNWRALLKKRLVEKL